MKDERQCPAGFDPKIWANADEAKRDAIIASHPVDPVGTVGGVEEPNADQVLLALLRTHASDLDNIRAMGGSIEHHVSELPEEDQPTARRLFLTAAVAGVPTEAQVQSLAKYLGWTISPEVETTANMRPLVPSRAARQQQTTTPQSRADVQEQQQQ